MLRDPFAYFFLFDILIKKMWSKEGNEISVLKNVQMFAADLS